MALNYWTARPNSEANIAASTFGALAGANAPGSSYFGGMVGKPAANYGRALAAQEYGQSGLRRQSKIGKMDLQRAFDKRMVAMPQTFNRRGMIVSGTYKRDTGRAYGDQLRNLGRLELALQDALAGSELQIQGAGRLMDPSGFDGLLSAADRRAQWASQIKAAS